MPHPPPDPTTSEPGSLSGLLAGLADIATEALDAVADRLEDADAQVPETWRRRLDPCRRGLTVPQLQRIPSSRDRLAGRVQRTPARSRPRGCQRQARPRARRTSSSSSSSSCDPGGGSDSEPPRSRRRPATSALLRTAQLAEVGS